MRFYLLLTFLFITIIANAQTALNFKTKFNDGLYLSYEDFKNNKPTYKFSEIKWDLYVNHEMKKALIKEVYLLENKKKIDIDGVWGICRDGKPYLKVQTHHTFTDSAVILAGIQQFGKICYFDYEDFDYKELMVKSFNPKNGKLRRQNTENRKYYYKQPMILDWNTGKIRQLTQTSLLSFIKDDLILYNALKKLSKEEAQDKLYGIVLRYNDKNTVYIQD